MGEESLPTLPFDRAVQQAIVSIKKGTYLLKCGRRGKPKFCPFRLSEDEKFLIWYSGQEERQLRLSSVMKIVPGQKTASFQRQLQPEKECQSFSLVYANGERSLDLICKDKAQADSWMLGLRVIVSRCHHAKPFNSLRSHRGVQSCMSSPAGFIRRKYNLGLSEDGTEFSQVHSTCGSPSLSLSERCFSDGLSHSSDSFYRSKAALSTRLDAMNFPLPNSPYMGSNHLKGRYDENVPYRLAAPTSESPQLEKKNTLRDVMIWGEKIEGILESSGSRSNNHDVQQVDVLLPKLLESATMLDLQNISLGAKHAALVTKQGEVFCWGEERKGRLGHKVDINVSRPKLVDSLSIVQVKVVACSEYQTYALTNCGELYAWGDTGFCDLPGENNNRIQWLPHKISGPLDAIIVSNVACGEWHSAMVSATGRLFTCGDGTFGVLGHGDSQSVYQPKEVESLKGLRVKSVACGSWHTAAIVEVMVDRFRFNAIGGKLFTWGDGDKGRLGHGDEEKKHLPTCVAQLVDHDFVQVRCGRMLTIVLSSHGTVYTMGSAMHGQLGNPHANDKSISMIEGRLREEFIKEIASGSYHVAALSTNGNVFTWGKGSNGQLGLGDIEDRNSPALVEALEDRQVESIICGSNSTAAICLHKSISVTDQSACSGCKVLFGFTRKKHNCYNCGLLFCSGCSTKKAINASLAPNKSKAFRVCDRCFNNLKRTSHSHGPLNQETDRIKQALNERSGFPEERENRRATTPKFGKAVSVYEYSDKESLYSRRMPAKNKGQNQRTLDPISSSLDTLPQWGQVPCPPCFDSHHNVASVALSPMSKSQVSYISPRYLEHSINETENGVSEPGEMLMEELLNLRAQVKSLEKKCQSGSQKIQECQQQLDETWTLAKEEAARCKAAKEVIKALALRLHKISENVPIERKEKDGIAKKLPQITTIYADTPTLKTASPISSIVTDLPKLRIQTEQPTDNIANSPVLFSETLKFLYGNDTPHDTSKPQADSLAESTESRKKGTEGVKLEWVEQYEPGVYITFTILPCGQKGLKRVRFSRRRFTEKEAQKWWEKNQALMYQKYNIEGYINSNQSEN